MFYFIFKFVRSCIRNKIIYKISKEIYNKRSSFCIYFYIMFNSKIIWKLCSIEEIYISCICIR